MKTLSKSKIIAYRQCPKRLWLEIHQPELGDDSGSEAVFEIGNRVGDIAQKIFDPSGSGINIDPNQIGWDEARSLSASLLQSGERPVFEAVLRIPGTFALADVMLPNHSFGELRWDVIEVKSSTSVKDYHRDDVALQSYIAERSGIRISKIGVAHIDSQFVYPGNDDYDGLLHVEDLTEPCRERHAEVESWVAEAQMTAAQETHPEVAVGFQCTQPFSCRFYELCHAHLPQAENSPGLLPQISGKKLEDWESRGITELKDTPDHELNANQQRVKHATLTGEIFFDGLAASEALASQALPAYFMDFETIQMAIPVWVGTRPYQQIPFQFSLHKLDTEGQLSHIEFLDLTGNDPREGFVQALLEGAGDRGAIYVYNASFEKSRIHELIVSFPAYAEGLNAINDRMVDLLPIARKVYYHPCQEGSWSLKAILPGICQNLSYGELEEVQDGMAAGRAYLEAIAPGTDAKRKAEVCTQLLEYCKLDTLATVEIWKTFMAGNGAV